MPDRIAHETGPRRAPWPRPHIHSFDSVAAASPFWTLLDCGRQVIFLPFIVSSKHMTLDHVPCSDARQQCRVSETDLLLVPYRLSLRRVHEQIIGFGLKSTNLEYF